MYGQRLARRLDLLKVPEFLVGRIESKLILSRFRVQDLYKLQAPINF